MAHYLGYVSEEFARRSNGRNSVIVVAANENAARDRAEELLGAQVGSLGTSTEGDGRGWTFEVLSAQEVFFEGPGPVASGGLDRGGTKVSF